MPFTVAGAVVAVIVAVAVGGLPVCSASIEFNFASNIISNVSKSVIRDEIFMNLLSQVLEN